MFYITGKDGAIRDDVKDAPRDNGVDTNAYRASLYELAQALKAE